MYKKIFVPVDNSEHSMASIDVAVELAKRFDAAGGATDSRNALVKARFEVKQFIVCVQRADKETVEEVCAPHLQAALLNVSLVNANLDEETTARLNYVIDRLKYVNDRIGLIY